MDSILLEKWHGFPVDISQRISMESDNVLVSSPTLCIVSWLLGLHYETCKVAVVLLTNCSDS